MEFNKKLQELRKQRKITQEELAKSIFVSRTAVSKWESGRGYPSIDSLKAIANYFGITVDDLLSGKELLYIAEQDSRSKTENARDLVFGILDCLCLLLLFAPLFGQSEGEIVRQVSLISLNSIAYIKIIYIIFLSISSAFGVLTLSLQNCTNGYWLKYKHLISLFNSVVGVLIFVATLEPYVAVFVFLQLIIKGIILIKTK